VYHYDTVSRFTILGYVVAERDYEHWPFSEDAPAQHIITLMQEQETYNAKMSKLSGSRRQKR